MIKNIIFDLDDTIIEDSKDYFIYSAEKLASAGYTDKNSYDVLNIIEDYDSSLSENNYFYSKQGLLESINKNLDTNYDINLINILNDSIAEYWCKSVYLPEATLQYLHSKYNLYVFTNWFEDVQAKRLENVGYLKYFKKVFGSDTFGAKPFKSAYNNVLNFIGASPDECIMIGDNKKTDILGSTNAGISAILFDYNEKRDKAEIHASNYTVITDLKELEKLL